MSEAAGDHAPPSEEEDPVLEVHDLHVSFEGRVGLGAGVAGKKAAVARAVDGVDLTLRRAEVLALENRIAHLEQLLEGLQDSVYREAERQGKRIAELEARTEPAALGEALSRDARERGL